MSAHDKEMKNIATNEGSSSSMRSMAVAALVGSAMLSSGSRRESPSEAGCLSLSKVKFPLTIIRLMLDAELCASGAEARRLIAAGQVRIHGVEASITADTVFQSPDELGTWLERDGKRRFFGHWLRAGTRRAVRLDK